MGISCISRILPARASTPDVFPFADGERVDLESLYLGVRVFTTGGSETRLSSPKLQFSMRDVFRASTIRSERGISYPFARSMEYRQDFRLIFKDEWFMEIMNIIWIRGRLYSCVV